MSQWIQKLFQSESNELDHCFSSSSQVLLQKSEEPIFVQENYHPQVMKQAEISLFPTLMPFRNFETSSENTQEIKKQRYRNIEGKRASRPPRRNEAMGLIAERPILQKKKYIKKKKPATPGILAVQYPTKNFLQNFKGAHLEYLQAKLSPSQLLASAVFCRLKLKSGISMEDYKQLYSTPQFQTIFHEMFREKYLYRAMMLSRSCKLSRMNHMAKLPVFEQSFKTKAFDHIN